MTEASRLLRWYRKHGRDLPWRNTQDPYRILVSEIMLQQTQVDRVKTFYKSWLKTFPNWNSLAKATNADVIRAWAGLGYNRRALALRDMARHVTNNGVPQTIESWEAIKGIGPYTARAVSAFAQHRRTMPIDTNVRRILGRLLLNKPFATAKDDKRIQKNAETFLPRRGHFWDVPQAIFDLSATICKKDPDCARCPLKKNCPVAERFVEGHIQIPKRATTLSHERRHRDKKYPDRIYRGRILKLVREQGSITSKICGPLITDDFQTELDQPWIDDMIERLIADRLLKKKGIYFIL